MENVISVQNASKSFGGNEVVSDLSFDVGKGEIFAFLGANGSGKTTTIRCLLGMMRPDSGKLLIQGKRYDTSMSSMLGYLPEERGLYTQSETIEMMTYFGEMKGQSHGKAKQRALDYLESVGIADKANLVVKNLSSGEQQKVQLGLTIINKPELLVLDEPTKGLDPVNRTILMNMLKEMNEKGSTIVFITHQMEEVEKIADRLVMIRDGRRVLYGDVNEVKSRFGDNTIQLTFKGAFPENETLYTATVETNTAEITPKENISPQEILTFLAEKKLPITRFEVTTPSLNEIFVMVQKGEVDET